MGCHVGGMPCARKFPKIAIDTGENAQMFDWENLSFPGGRPRGLVGRRPLAEGGPRHRQPSSGRAGSRAASAPGRTPAPLVPPDAPGPAAPRASPGHGSIGVCLGAAGAGQPGTDGGQGDAQCAAGAGDALAGETAGGLSPRASGDPAVRVGPGATGIAQSARGRCRAAAGAAARVQLPGSQAWPDAFRALCQLGLRGLAAARQLDLHRL